jgi:hypothetical protein
MAVSWAVKGYSVSETKSVIDEWMSKASDKAKGKFDARLKYLISRLPTDWDDKYAHQLSAKCDGLFEIRFEVDGVAHRPLCFFGPNRLEFTIVLYAIEHNDKLKPSDACQTGQKRKNEIGKGDNHPIVYDAY